MSENRTLSGDWTEIPEVSLFPSVLGLTAGIPEKDTRAREMERILAGNFIGYLQLSRVIPKDNNCSGFIVIPCLLSGYFHFRQVDGGFSFV